MFDFVLISVAWPCLSCPFNLMFQVVHLYCKDPCSKAIFTEVGKTDSSRLMSRSSLKMHVYASMLSTKLGPISVVKSGLK